VYGHPSTHDVQRPLPMVAGPWFRSVADPAKGWPCGWARGILSGSSRPCWKTARAMRDLSPQAPISQDEGGWDPAAPGGPTSGPSATTIRQAMGDLVETATPNSESCITAGAHLAPLACA